MPQVLPVLGQIALNAAIGIGASVLANALRPQRSGSTQSVTTSRGLKFELTIGETVALSAIWGRGRTGGQLTFAQEYGPNNQFLKLKIDCGRGWFDGLETVIADEKALTLTGSNDDVHGRVAEQYRDSAGNPRVWFKYYDGRPGQAADGGLIAAAPTRWGVNHRSTATPYVIVTLSYDADLFPSSTLPSFGFVWRGLRLYDWRKDSTMPGGAGAHRWDDQSTWTWTDNPAVMAWNWRRGYWRNGIRLFGMGFSRYANDLAYFTAAANLADEELYFAETGATLKRYAFGREIFDDEEHLAVLRQFEESWCGASFDRGGAYAPVPAASVMPVLTLEDRHRVDGASVSANRWGKVSAKKTKIHGSFSPAADLFISTPYAARINVDLEALTRGPKAQPFDQPYEHRPERAQMRAEIALRRNLHGATRTETFGPVANVLEPGDAITRNCEWGPTLMIVESVERGPDGIGKTITMTGWSNTIVPDPDEGFLEMPPAIGPLPEVASRTLQVPGFDCFQYQRITAGNEEPYARATWTFIDDPNCERVIVKVWPDGADELTTAQYFEASSRLQNSFVFGPLKPETSYRRVALLVRKDGRQTYPTGEGTFMTGPFVAAVTVAPDSVRPEHLAQELRNERGWLFGIGAGESLGDHLTALEEQIAELAAAGITDRVDNKLQVSILKARSAAATAAIVETRKVVAELNAAFAQFQVEVLAQLNQMLAGGLIKIEGRVDAVSAKAQILFKVRADIGDAFPEEAALVLGAEKLLSGASDSWVGIMADRMYFLATDGEVVTQPFTINANYVRINTLRFQHLSSIDGATIVLNGETGNFVLGGG